MPKYIIAFASITYANKAKAVLNKAGITAEVKRTPNNVARGCGYSVSAEGQLKKITTLLDENNIPYKNVSEVR